MDEAGELLRRLGALAPEERERVLAAARTPSLRTFERDWPSWAHRGQLPPDELWRIWVLLGGRGFGKTRAGAEWVSRMARETPGARIALVAATADEARRVMIEGRSGLLATARPGERRRMRWEPSRGRLEFASGAEAQLFSAANPESLRGPEHHFAWADELAKWRRADEAWTNLTLGLRAGAAPRALVTTTPRAVPALKALLAQPGTVLTGGATRDKPHLPADFIAAMEAIHGGTRLGRQELEGELIDEVEGALWTRSLIERCRAPAPAGGPRRCVVGVDPPASDGGTCGIVACAVDEAGTAYVLADHSATGLSPEGWARKVAAAAEAWRAQRVVAEANNGGAMVATVLRGAALQLPVRLVHAAEGKTARAAPVATLFESGRARLAGRFPALEDQLCGLTWAGRYEGPGGSPDRADAMVWALTELMLGPPRGEPRVRQL